MVLSLYELRNYLGVAHRNLPMLDMCIILIFQCSWAKEIVNICTSNAFSGYLGKGIQNINSTVYFQKI